MRLISFIIGLGLLENIVLTAGQVDRGIFQDALNDFSQVFYAKVAEEMAGNIVFSPLSLHSALSILFHSATKDSETRNELANALRLVVNQDLLSNGYREFFENLEHDSAITFINKLWLSHGAELQKEFMLTTKNDYHAEFERVNFRASSQVVNTINDWITNITHGLITSLVDDVDVNTQLLITNGLYFNLTWGLEFENDHLSGRSLNREEFHIPSTRADLANLAINMTSRSGSNSSGMNEGLNSVLGETTAPADEKETTTRDFFILRKRKPDCKERTLEDGTRVVCVPMIRTAEYNVKRQIFSLTDTTYGDYEVLTIPYENQDYALKIVLPHEDLGADGLAILEDQLSSKVARDKIGRESGHDFVNNIFDVLKESDDSQRADEVMVIMPKFEIFNQLNAAMILRQFGVRKENKSSIKLAELGEILENGDPLHVGKIRHAAAIKVDENGTEGGAGSTVELVLLSAVLPDPKQEIVTIDRPFFFAVMDLKNKLPVMVGRVNELSGQPETDSKETR